MGELGWKHAPASRGQGVHSGPSLSPSPVQGLDARRRWPETMPPFAASCSSLAQNLCTSAPEAWLSDSKASGGGQRSTSLLMMWLMWTGSLHKPPIAASPSACQHPKMLARQACPAFSGNAPLCQERRGRRDVGHCTDAPSRLPGAQRGGLRALPFDTAWAPNVNAEVRARDGHSKCREGQPDFDSPAHTDPPGNRQRIAAPRVQWMSWRECQSAFGVCSFNRLVCCSRAWRLSSLHLASCPTLASFIT